MDQILLLILSIHFKSSAIGHTRLEIILNEILERKIL